MMHIGSFDKNGPVSEKRTILYNGQKPCPQRVHYSETPLYNNHDTSKGCSEFEFLR